MSPSEQSLCQPKYGMFYLDYNSFFQNAPIGVFMTTCQGTSIFANPTFARMYGYESPRHLMEEIKDIGEQLYIDRRDRDKFLHLLETQGQVTNFECRQLRRDGSIFWTSQNAWVVHDEDGNTFYQGFTADITEKKQTEQVLWESENRFRKVIEDISNIAVQGYDEERRVTFWNAASKDLYGYSEKEAIGKKIDDLIIPSEIQDKRKRQHQRWIDFGEKIPAEELHLVDKHGNKVPVFSSHTMNETAYGKEIFCLDIDLTDRKKTDVALRNAKERLDFALQGSNSALWDWYIQTGDIVFNEQWANIIGYTLEELHPVSIKTWMDLCHPEDLQVSNALLDKYHAGQTPIYECEVRMKHKDGSWIWVLDRGKVVEWDEMGKPIRMTGIHTDITKLKNYAQQLEYLSLHDQLTGLYNRAYLENELKRLQYSRDFPISIICMDLDGLKLVNDTLGHEHGDKHLQDCARVLHESLRAADIVARFGGDEFVALLPRTDQNAGEKLANRIQTRIEEFNKQESREIPMGLSIGVACAKEGNQDLFEVFKKADDLMYRDKLHRNATSRSQIMKGLMAALEERDFITSGHALRLEDLCLNLGKERGLSASQLSNLHLLAQVHDLGKVGIPDNILFKPSPLTEEEWQIMRQHPEKGYRIAQSMTDLTGISELILKHHERWDGKGYPLGIKGEEIPIECRILAIVDAYDAMVNERPYRSAMSSKEAVQELRRCAGSQFDPELVEVFIQVLEQ